MSQLIYLMSVLPKPSVMQLKEIETAIFKFIWGKGQDKIKRSVLKNELDKGGFKVPDQSIQADSLKIPWVKKFLDDENYAKWKDVAHSKVMLTENLSIFEYDTSYEQALQFSNSEFWAETAGAWSDVVKLDQPSSGDLLSAVLWCNQRLKLESNPGISRRGMLQRSVYQISDLYDFNRKCIYVVGIWWNPRFHEMSRHSVACRQRRKSS